jgi:hypothetical protein
MVLLRRQLRPFAWLALAALLALALLPSISHALAFAQGSTVWAEVCTPQGSRLVAVADAAGGTDTDAPASRHAMGQLEHCPLCALSTGALGLPSAPPAVVAALLGSDAVPALFLHAPRTLFAWASAQPRGPPSCS